MTDWFGVKRLEVGEAYGSCIPLQRRKSASSAASRAVSKGRPVLVCNASSSFGHRGVERRPPQLQDVPPGRIPPCPTYLSNLPTGTREYLLTRPNSGVFHIPHPTIKYYTPRSLVCIHSTNHTTQKTQPFTQTISSQSLSAEATQRLCFVATQCEARAPSRTAHRLTTASLRQRPGLRPAPLATALARRRLWRRAKTSNNRLLATCVSRSRALIHDRSQYVPPPCARAF